LPCSIEQAADGVLQGNIILIAASAHIYWATVVFDAWIPARNATEVSLVILQAGQKTPHAACGSPGIYRVCG
jgi:hypothetical protein